jgi:hypothetical protein
MKKDNPFYRPKPFKEYLTDFYYGIVFWKGRKKGIVYTRDITLDDLRRIFFPRSFEEKYTYLGSIPWRDDSSLFKAIYPLVLAMDYEAKPKWCPRWFLRFLHVFGDDRSVIRVRNRYLSDLNRRLTKGILMWDYKTKWADYDLRISISAPKHLQDLANDIERGFYSRGRQEELIEEILKLDPNASIIRGSVDRLVEQYNNLINKDSDESNPNL